MKKYLLIMCLCIWAGNILADRYKILFVNDPSLKYTNGKKVKKNDIITDAGKIKWEKERQAVKAINLTTNRQTMFLGKNWVRATGTRALVEIRHFSTQTRDTPKDLYEKLSTMFESQYGLMDKIEIPTDVELSDTHYFTAAYHYGDAKLTKKLGYKKGAVIIDMSLFNVDNEILEPRDLLLSIEYVNEEDLSIISARDDVEIFIVPQILE